MAYCQNCADLEKKIASIEKDLELYQNMNRQQQAWLSAGIKESRARGCNNIETLCKKFDQLQAVVDAARDYRQAQSKVLELWENWNEKDMTEAHLEYQETRDKLFSLVDALDAPTTK